MRRAPCSRKARQRLLLTGQIGFRAAAVSINYEVIFYLFGVFVIVRAAEMSGVIDRLVRNLSFASGSSFGILFVVVFGLGTCSAILMNDTVAIAGTSIVMQLCRGRALLIKPLLLALAYAVTIGSVLSPIGNPQNLLIAADSGMRSPFAVFFHVLWLPTLINLFVAYALIAAVYRNAFRTDSVSVVAEEGDHDAAMGRIVMISIVLLIGLMLAKIVLGFMDWNDRLLEFHYIAVVAAMPLLLLSRRRKEVLWSMDWGTLVFFASMFVLMRSVWDSGFFQQILEQTQVEIHRIPVILAVSTILSQLMSNVPLVALYLPLLVQNGVGEGQLLALGVGSTIAGNLFIFGAASTVIIIQNAELRKCEIFTFFEFARLGIPLTLINLAVYYFFLSG